MTRLQLRRLALQATRRPDRMRRHTRRDADSLRMLAEFASNSEDGVAVLHDALLEAYDVPSRALFFLHGVPRRELRPRTIAEEYAMVLQWAQEYADREIEPYTIWFIPTALGRQGSVFSISASFLDNRDVLEGLFGSAVRARTVQPGPRPKRRRRKK